VFKRAPLHWLCSSNRQLWKPVWIVSGVCTGEPRSFLSSRTTHENCSSLERDLSRQPLPECFSSEDIEFHSKEEENINRVGHILLLFGEQDVLPINGIVEPEDYDLAVENNRRFKDTFIALAKDEEEKGLFKNLWPYQEPGSV